MIRALLLLLALLLPLPAAAATGSTPAPGFTPAQRAEIVAIIRDALVRDPSILRDAVEALQADQAKQQTVARTQSLAQAHQQLVADPADPVAGNPHGNVTMVVFFDTRCPYCRAMEPTVAQLIAADPNLRVVYKDLPILGPGSVMESEALMAAIRQGAYFRLRTALMSAPPNADLAAVEKITKSLGLDWPRLRRDMQEAAVMKQLQTNVALAHRLGIDGTPAYIIGDRLLPGAVPLQTLEQAVAAARHG